MRRFVIPIWASLALAGCGGSPSGRADGAATPEPDLAMPAGPTCGDNICNGGEDCKSCPGDCGACPPCGGSPTCDSAAGAPATPTPRPDLSIGTPATSGTPAPIGGPYSCDVPQLRLRVQKARVNSGSATLYCVVTATDGAASEVALTTRTQPLGAGGEFYFDPSVGLFWGQKALAPTPADLQIEYKCFQVVSDSWAAVLQAAGSAAQMASGFAGMYGWAFGLAGAAANVAAAALQAANGDKLQLDVQQTLHPSDLLDLTNGRYFTVQQAGAGFDWTLFVETWGCAAGLPPKT